MKGSASVKTLEMFVAEFFEMLIEINSKILNLYLFRAKFFEKVPVSP